MKKLFSDKTKVIFYNEHPTPIQGMLDYDWLCNKSVPSIVAIVNPKRKGFHKCFYGSNEIMIPVYKSIDEATKYQNEADVLINFASTRSAYESTKQAILEKSINTIVVVAEGIPENQTREMIRLGKEHKTWLIGPSTVGAIKAGSIRVGYSGGSTENLIESRLYRPGSVGVVTVSGGMSNEIYNIVSRNSDGVNEGLAVGGDTFPFSTLLDNVLRLEADPAIKMLVMVGEIGGTDEYEIADAIRSNKIKKPVVAWVSGTVAKLFPTDVQFGHAGAKSGGKGESAQDKNKALKDAGAFVPKSFNDLGKMIKKVFKTEVTSQKNYQAPVEIKPNIPALDFNQATKEGLVRKSTSIISTISDDRGEELTYNKREIDQLANKPLGETINQLWFNGKLSQKASEFIELCLILTADHGPAVVTAHNAITASRAGKDIVAATASGLLTIGERHGGAINDAAKWIFNGVETSQNARDLIDNTKKQGKLIMGIGHRIKSAQNPDGRVELLKKFARKNLKKTPHLDFALLVEKETLKKKNNLILNVDGTIAAVFLDILVSDKYTQQEITELIDIEIFNAIFILGRTIGIIGHVLDQKRLHEPLYRHEWDDIYYVES